MNPFVRLLIDAVGSFNELKWWQTFFILTPQARYRLRKVKETRELFQKELHSNELSLEDMIAAIEPCSEAFVITTIYP